MRELMKSAISTFLECGRAGAGLGLRSLVPDDELNATLNATFRAMDALQRGMVDLTWALFGANE